MHALEVNGLKKSYITWKGFQRKVTPALKDVSFKVRKGEIFGLLGPNGAGKTTTVNIIAGILTRDAGSVQAFGKEIDEAIRNRMNVATAYAGLMDYLTVFQNLKVYARLYGMKDDSKLHELMKKFEIFDLRNRRYHMLSSGQKTRVNLCKGLVNNPDLLLLDEATVGLDPDIAQNVRQQIKAMGTSILFTSHNMYEVEELCTRAAFLYDGRILRTGTPKNLTRLIKEQIVTIDFYPSKDDPIKILQKLNVDIIKQSPKQVVLLAQHADRQVHNILHPLLNKGFVIKDLSIEKPSLEDVFVKMSRGRNEAV